MKTAIITGIGGYLGRMIEAELTKRDWECWSAMSPFGPEPIDAFIHAAASPIDRRPLLDLSEVEFDKPIGVALDAFYWARHVVPHMTRDSVFLGITTQAIEFGEPLAKMGSYGVAKIALRGFLRVLAPELAPKGIRVNAMAPDFLPGGMNRDLPLVVQKVLASKSRATPEQIVEIIARICDDPTAYPSGMSINALGEAEPL